MTESNRQSTSSLAGGAYCASFEISPAGVPWVQAKNGVMNMYYPHSSAPSVTLSGSFTATLTDVAFPAWKQQQFLTITFKPLDLLVYAEFINGLFVEFYACGPDYVLATDVVKLSAG